MTLTEEELPPLRPPSSPGEVRLTRKKRVGVELSVRSFEVRSLAL